MSAALSQIRQEKVEKLLGQLKNKELELTKMRLELTTGKLKNFRKISALKKEIAQIKTVLREREIINQSVSANNG
jgi:large subunit ribosomal protein L29